MFCLNEAKKELRKRLLAVLVGCFVVNIICLLATITCLAFSYIGTTPSMEQINFQIAVAADALLILSLVLYLLTVKLKSLVSLLINTLVLVAALVTRVLVIALRTNSPTEHTEPIWLSGALLGCTAC